MRCKRIRQLPEYQGKYKESGTAGIFISNLLLFLVVLFLFGLPIREMDFLINFIHLSILGQVLNLFDLVVIDLLWWRNTERIRFSQLPEKDLYLSPRKHLASFGRGILMYIAVALIDGWLLTCF